MVIGGIMRHWVIFLIGALCPVLPYGGTGGKRGAPQRLAIVSFLIALWLLIPTRSLFAQSVAEPAADQIFDQVAAELVNGLDGNFGVVDRLRARFRGGAGIAVWPLRPAEVPLPKSVLDSWNESLTNALLRSSHGRWRLMSRNDMDAALREADFGDRPERGNPVASLLKESTADYLISGKAHTTENGVAVRFSLIECRTMATLAVSHEYTVPVDFLLLPAQQDSLALDSAIHDAATYFAKTIPHLSVLRNRGIRQADSGIETPLARFLNSRLIPAIADSASNALTDSRVRVIDAVIDAASLQAVKTRSAIVEKALTGPDEGSFLIEGNYWITGPVIDLALTARGADGTYYGWNRRVLSASIPPVLLAGSGPGGRAPNTAGWEKAAPFGPIAMQLSSNKGANPSYAVGDNVVLLFKLGGDAILNCFYRDKNNEVAKIFPNKFMPNGRVAAGTAVSIPGDGMNFTFQATEPVGVERVKCFALSQDVSAKLPREIAQSNMAPLPRDLGDRLSEIYHAVPGVAMTEATMVVTIHP